MVAFTVRRLILALVTMVAISVLSFVIIRLPPGDFVDAYIAQQSSSGSSVSMQEAQSLRKLYGLDQPGYVQYLKWLPPTLHRAFGHALEWDPPVIRVISGLNVTTRLS